MKFSVEHNLIENSQITQTTASLESYRQELNEQSQESSYDQPENCLHLPFDESLIKKVKATAEELKTPTLQYIVVIGIGGSNLGTQAVYDAVAGSMSMMVDRIPKLLFLDTVSDERMTAVTREMERLYSKDDFAVMMISKSGTTTEVAANTEVFLEKMRKSFGDVKDRLAVITAENSKLWKLAENQSLTRIGIPQHISGRFSVFSAVGLLPLHMANIELSELLAGARDAVKDGVSDDLSQNHSLTSAAVTYHHYEKGRTIHNTFLFSPKLEALGKWYRQLMGESLGKEQDIEGNLVNTGIIPMVSIGSTDLHSMAQLYFGGPDVFFNNLVCSYSGDVNRVPRTLHLGGLVKDLSGKSLENVMQSIVGGVKHAYQKIQRPFVEINLEGITPYQLGYYLQFRMIEMMYLAKLMNVNAFDQPAVELYKEKTRTLLNEKPSE